MGKAPDGLEVEAERHFKEALDRGAVDAARGAEGHEREEGGEQARLVHVVRDAEAAALVALRRAGLPRPPPQLLREVPPAPAA